MVINANVLEIAIRLGVILPVSVLNAILAGMASYVLKNAQTIVLVEHAHVMDMEFVIGARQTGMATDVNV